MNDLLGRDTGNVGVEATRAAAPSPTFDELEIPATFRIAAEREITAGEQVLWVGRPSRDPRVHPRKTGIVMIGAGLLAFAFLIATGTLAFVGTKELFPFLFAGVLAVIGSACMLPLLANPAKSCRSCYVVTNRRAILVEMSLLAREPRAQSYLPHQLAGLERRDHPEVPGAGDLIFEYVLALPGHSFDKNGFMLQQGALAGRTDTPQRVPRGFTLLDQVREVEGLIRTRLLGALEETPEVRVPGPSALLTTEPAQIGSSTEGSRPDAETPFDSSTVPADLRQKALAGLDPNEKLVWIGQPEGKLVLLRGVGYFALGGLGAVVAAVWLAGTLLPSAAGKAATNKQAAAQQQAPAPQQQPSRRQGKGGRQQAGRNNAAPEPNQPARTAAAPEQAPKGNVLFPIGAFLVSLGISAVPLLRWKSAGRTCYALTNRRAIVYREGLFGPTRESYSPLEVAGMRRSNSWIYGGGGDLIFRTATVVTTTRSTGGGSNSSVKTTHYGFLALAGVGQVERIVRETLIDRFVDKLNQANQL